MARTYLKELRNLRSALDTLRSAAASDALRDPGAIFTVPDHHWDMPHGDNAPGHVDVSHIDASHLDAIHLDGYSDNAHDDAFHADQGHDDGGHDDGGHDDGGHDEGHDDEGHGDEGHDDEGHDDGGEQPWDGINRLINELDTVLQMMQKEITHAFERRMVQHAEQASIVLAALAARVNEFDARLRRLEGQGKDTP